MNKILLPLFLALPLVGCGALGDLSASVEEIKAATSIELAEIDERYTAGEITAEDRDIEIANTLEEAQAALDAAAREAGDSLLGTGNDVLDLILLILFGSGSTAGALSLGRRFKARKTEE